MISHGMAGFLKERMYDASDAYRLHVCDMCVPGQQWAWGGPLANLSYHSCGLTAIARLKVSRFECRICNNKTQISQVFIREWGRV